MGDADDHAGAGGRPWWRLVATVVAVVAALAASATIGYRVLAPAEVVTEATSGYPPPVGRPEAGVIGTLLAAPLIVDGRLRVYATKRQVRADAPVDARTQRSPFWSYRRWPEQVVGVVAVEATVVTRWSDGKLVAIDARTGRVAWRTDGPVPGVDEYAGRRTGAATVYAPDGLYTTGRTVVASTATATIGVDVTDGTVRWRLPGSADRVCAAFTTVAGRFALASGCADGRPTVSFYDVGSGRPVTRLGPAPALTGEVIPLGCRVGRSDCAGLRIGPVEPAAVSNGAGPVDPGVQAADTQGVSGAVAGPAQAWTLRGPEPVPAAALAVPGAWLAEAAELGDVAVAEDTDGRLVARRVDTGARVWTWAAGPDGRARVVAAQPGRLYLLTGGYWLTTVDAATGVELSRFLCTYGRERTGWTVGYAYASGGFVLVERLQADADPALPDDEYYFIAQPVILAAA